MNDGPCRTYLVSAEKSPEALLIDPVLENIDSYVETIEREELHLSYIIDTHTHADHLSAGPSLSDHFQAPYIMHESAGHCATYTVKGGETLRAGELSVTCEHTPGHTSDSIMLVFEDRLLTGDFLFIGDSGSGRLDLPTGDPGEHFDSLQKLKRYPDALKIFPAHDYHERTSSTLGRERQTNPRLRFKSRDEYVRFLSDLAAPPPEWMTRVIEANHACTRDPHAVEIPKDLPCCEAGGASIIEKVQGVVLISAEEARRKIDAGSALILDVRTPDEYVGQLGHIQNSHLIPVQELLERLPELECHRDKEVITVCKTGGRSLIAAGVLAQAGFRNVASMQGGMLQWNISGYPIIRT